MLIVLQTDFGYKDPYVGVMKGVIKTINPDAEIVDLTHGVTRHNVLEAAFNLLVSAEYFPRGTIFVTVVDPGVGTSRRAVLVRTRNYVLIGPDNGVLSLLALKDGVLQVFDISNTPYRLPRVSSTFHGRDIFAPVAAWVSKGVPLESTGEPVPPETLIKLGVEEPVVNPGQGWFEAVVLSVDVFGNISLYAGENVVESLGIRKNDKLVVEAPGGRIECTMVNTFGEVSIGEGACYINSFGFFEIAVNQGDASRILKTIPLEKVRVHRKT
ncbi:SAM-dependent chlorinase/fluorinase [Thermosphaera chiliense]|uniref:SAM-dependent chlorinase/fluorinase n=1 Tax=Thermosphaera chiliense TaxID=3402707 RepID=A0A7M1UQ39_9CREN|nr:SAM-dependent chlorinase/fluorinase [Thermosphaera aggregans]QOR94360.1 SAM-dependent chlorinase/fluorinase [Thermosphaera aggregans]